MRKRLLLFILIILAAGAAVILYLKDRKFDDFEPQIIDKLAELVREGTGGLYKLEIGKLDIDLLSARISLINAKLIPDSTLLLQLDKDKKAPDDVFILTVDRINIEGVSPAAFMQSRALDLDTLIITNPNIEVFHTLREYNKEKLKDTASIGRRILKNIDRIKLNRLLIQDATLIHINTLKENHKNNLDSVTIDLQDILIDSTTVLDTTRILFAKDIQIRMKNYELRTADSVYSFKTEEVFISVNKKDVQLKNVSFEPRITRQEFVRRQREVKELYTVRFEEVNFESVNWWQFANAEQLIADSVILKNGSLDVYCNRSKPAFSGSKIGNFPHQALMKLPFEVFIQHLDIENFNIAYIEFNPRSEQEGTLSFKNANGSIKNITNIPAMINLQPSMVATARASLLGLVPVFATFSFNLPKAKEGEFSVDFEMKAIDAEKLNVVTHPLGMFSVKEGKINSLAARINGNNYHANGTVSLFYKGLKIVPLKLSGDDSGALKERGFLGFLANAFVVKSENIAGEEARIARLQYERDINKSFFALIWKTLLSGMLEAVGAPADLAKPA